MPSQRPTAGLLLLLLVSFFFLAHVKVTQAFVLPASPSCRQTTRSTATSITCSRPKALPLSLSSSSPSSSPLARYPSILTSSRSRSLTSLRAIEIVDDTTGEDEEDDGPAPMGTFAWFKRWWKKTAKIDKKKIAGTSFCLSGPPSLPPSPSPCPSCRHK